MQYSVRILSITVVIPYYLSLRYNIPIEIMAENIVVIPYYLSLRYNTC